MKTEIEDLLRHTLETQGRGVPASPDPYTRFAEREQVHRRNRRAMMASAASLVLVAAAFVQSGVVPLPDTDGTPTTNERTTNERTTNERATPITPASGTPLVSAPIRGSLAGDEAWLRGLRESISTVQMYGAAEDGDTEAAGPQTVKARNVRLVYAGDISREKRLALAVVTVTFREKESRLFVWYVGKAGAAPEEMTQDQPVQDMGEVGHTRALIWPTALPSNEEVILVLAPPEATIEADGPIRYLASGRTKYGWPIAAAPDGATTINRRDARPDGAPLDTVRVRIKGAWLAGPQPPLPAAPVDPESAELRAAAETATVGMRGRPVSERLLRDYIVRAFEQSGQLDTWEGLNVRVLWNGEVDGVRSAVLTLQPKGGGVLVYSMQGGDDDAGTGVTVTTRVLLPADGAFRRPVAWRSYEALSAGYVEVLAPRGAKAVQVKVGAETIPVELDASGAGRLKLEPGMPATVQAFDADGNLMGEFPIHGYDEEGSLMMYPGETRATRVVP